MYQVNDKLFSGTGTHGDSNTAFFLQGGSGATAGDFSLGDKLVWDSSEGTLNIDGTLTIGSPDGTVSSSAQLASDLVVQLMCQRYQHQQLQDKVVVSHLILTQNKL